MTTVRAPRTDAAAGGRPEDETAPLTRAGLLSSLSYALDLTEGQPMGHAVRTCLIGLRIADAFALSEADRQHLHFALILKDAGCSSNAARMFALFGGDDILAKRDAKVRDWRRVSEAFRYALRHTAPHAPLSRRLRKLAELSRVPGRVMDALTQARCTRGADIARSLGMPPAVADAIYHLDEHWDGQGAPHHRSGGEIPLLARIAGLAQTVEVFAATFGPDHALAMARARSGKWFDPEAVRALAAFAGDREFWEDVRVRPMERLEATTPPALRGRAAPAADVDSVCDAFAAIVDAKSSYTAEHSSRVRFWADRIAARLGFGPARRARLSRAALLHDLGKLAVPNLILDKPAALTAAEFAIVRVHPFHTREILKDIPGFARLAVTAAAHHEKLDGSGYDQGLSAPDLTPDMRVLAVADIYDALTTDRPYRAALTPDAALALLRRESGKTLDPDCVAALREDVAGEESPALKRAA